MGFGPRGIVQVVQCCAGLWLVSYHRLCALVHVSGLDVGARSARASLWWFLWGSRPIGVCGWWSVQVYVTYVRFIVRRTVIGLSGWGLVSWLSDLVGRGWYVILWQGLR